MASTTGLTRVVEVDPHSDRRWTTFVANHPDALIYHDPSWLQALEAEYGEPPASLACEGGDGALCGVLPLLRASGIVTGRRLVSLPRTPISGPLAPETSAAAALLRGAVERAKDLNLRLTIKMQGADLDGLVEGVRGRATHSTYTMELPADPDQLRFGDSRNHGAIKRAVNKAAKAGVEVREARSETDLAEWYVLYLETMRAHLSPPRPYRFFRALWRIMRPHDRMRLVLAERRDRGETRLLAGSVFLRFGGALTYAFNGSRRTELSLRPNDAIVWHAIRDACRQGFRRYDFGEVDTTNKGLADFKRKWGCRPEPIYRYDVPGLKGDPLGVRHTSGRTSSGIAAAAWRRMPLSVTARAGDLINRYL
jgi:CelD/BcsL family acetyltransferase involved in cellulose biosynthesis